MEQSALCWPYVVQLLRFPAMKSTRLHTRKTFMRLRCRLPCFRTEYHQLVLAWRPCQSQVRETSLGHAEPRLPYSGQLGLLKGDKCS